MEELEAAEWRWRPVHGRYELGGDWRLNPTGRSHGVPNGDPNFDRSELEARFAPIADEITDFARVHNLFLDKYHHHNCSWDLRFNHPRGGQGSLTVYCPTADTALIGSVWFLDDYAHFTRCLHVRTPREIAKDSSRIGADLSAELGAITAVPFGQWSQVATGYEQHWGRYTKEEFERMTPQYPDPLI